MIHTLIVHRAPQYLLRRHGVYSRQCALAVCYVLGEPGGVLI